MPETIELTTIPEIRKAIKLGFPDKANDWIIYQWQRAVNNTDLYLPPLTALDMPVEKSLALAVLETYFGIDLNGHTVEEDVVTS